MVKNGSKKRVTLYLQTKRGCSSSILETPQRLIERGRHNAGGNSEVQQPKMCGNNKWR